MNRMVSMPAGFHDRPGLATTPHAEIVSPFMSQTAIEPSSLRNAMSDLPSLLKSPVPTTCQRRTRIGGRTIVLHQLS